MTMYLGGGAEGASWELGGPICVQMAALAK